jgi:hypothetical protein
MRCSRTGGRVWRRGTSEDEPYPLRTRGRKLNDGWDLKQNT